jgi:protoporphyrinogen oxidase
LLYEEIPQKYSTLQYGYSMNSKKEDVSPVQTDVLIVGAGPCGIGAATRCQELTQAQFPKVKNWLLIESQKTPGGNAASFTDSKGFTWDSGSHVICSHYPYFDQFFLEKLKGEIEYKPRHGWVYLCDQYIPFPVQNNLQKLPSDQLLKCLKDLPRQAKREASDDFKGWLESNFGAALCELFFTPTTPKCGPTHLSPWPQVGQHARAARNTPTCPWPT